MTRPLFHVKHTLTTTTNHPPLATKHFIMDFLPITYSLNALLMILLPIGLGWWVQRRWSLPWKLLGVGALTFVGSQVVRLPLLAGLSWLISTLWPDFPREWATPFNLVVLSLSAGLFEEGARYMGYRWLAPEARTWPQAVGLGAGHGGIEAVLLGLLTAFTLAQMFILRTTDLSALPIPAEQLTALTTQVEAFWSAEWYLSLLGAVERGFALILHITLSVMVMQVFLRGQRRWLWLAVLWHALANMVGVGVLQAAGPLAAEGALAVVALVSLGILWRLRDPHPAPLG